jgi:hypothetical protein
MRNARWNPSGQLRWNQETAVAAFKFYRPLKGKQQLVQIVLVPNCVGLFAAYVMGAGTGAHAWLAHFHQFRHRPNPIGSWPLEDNIWPITAIRPIVCGLAGRSQADKDANIVLQCSSRTHSDGER